MASAAGASISVISVSSSLRQTQAPASGISDVNSVLPSIGGRTLPSLKLNQGSSRFRVSCALQLELPDESSVTGEPKFAALGADSLDRVRIVMGLKEEFDISVEKESAQSISLPFKIPLI